MSPACLGQVRSPDAVRCAFESGINFFFVTADMHWPYYEELRRGIADLLADGVARREDIVVAAVSYVSQTEFGWAPYDEVVQVIPGLDHLDVLVVGGAYEADVDARVQQRREQVAERFLGARAVGVTFHERRSAVRFANEDLVDVAYLRYNPAHPGARDDVFPHLTDSRTLVYGFKSVSESVTERDRDRLQLDRRFWLPTTSDYYRFALDRCEVDGVLCSPSTPEEIAMLREALERGPLTADQTEHLVRLADLSLGRKQLRR